MNKVLFLQPYLFLNPIKFVGLCLNRLILSYKEYLPHPALINYIEAYWENQLDQSDKTVMHRILPDGCTDILYDRLAQDSYLVGMMTRFKDNISAPGSSILGIRFKAGAMAAFYPLPQHELINNAFPYQDIKLAEIIWSGKDLLNNINKYFLEKLPLKPLVLSAIVADIYATRGCARIPMLADRYNMSERKLERLFKQDVGITVKGLSKIIRFTNALSLIRDVSNQRSLTQIALDAGYYDQAHLCNQIKAYTGLTPVQLV